LGQVRNLVQLAGEQVPDMSRYPIANGSIPNFPVTPIVDTQGKIAAVILENVSAADVYVSEDPLRLQVTDNANIPTVGLHFPPDGSPNDRGIVVISHFNGKLYARSPGTGASMEAIVNEYCT
jgi:hypothetical protein